MARLDETELTGSLDVTHQIAADMISYTGVFTAEVDLKSMARNQAVYCLADIGHGNMPSLEAGVLVKVNLG